MQNTENISTDIRITLDERGGINVDVKGKTPQPEAFVTIAHHIADHFKWRDAENVESANGTTAPARD